MAARLIGDCVLAVLLLGVLIGVSEAQQDQKEGGSQVDWFVFDASDVRDEGKVVKLPLLSHRRTRWFDHGRQDAVVHHQPASGPAFQHVDRSDAGVAAGRCFHRGLGVDGECAAVANCMWAARHVQDWGHTETCADGALVCCPVAADHGRHDAFPSPSWDPYTFQYFPNCPVPHGHALAHQQVHYPPPPPHAAPEVQYVGPQGQAQGPQARPPFPTGVNPFQDARPMAPQRPPVQHAGPPMPAQAARPPVQQLQQPARPPVQQLQQPARPPPQPVRPEPEAPLVPLIDADVPAAGQQRKPGDVARMKCVEYERYAPTVRYGPDKDCVPNHTYPIGGNPALPKEFPHFAQLGVGRRGNIQYYCGGSLIAPTWIMTAAHCLYSGSKQVQWVRLGDLEPDSDTDDSNPQIIAVAEVVRHPDYKVIQVYNDIALLRLARAPDMTTPHVRPACLQADKKLKKDKLNLIGFGLTEENGDPAKVLMEVAIWQTPGDKCVTFFQGSVNLRQLPDGLQDESQLCAGLDQVGKDACQGDSGGPLNTPYSPTCMLHVAGVTSFGQGCGRGAPGVYTRVSHFVPWIERIAWPEYFQEA